jgi:adenosylcobinamide-GDP ribazoletransferase
MSDFRTDRHLRGERSPPFRPFAELIASLTFLTRLPIPFARTFDPPPLRATMRLFAIAGAIIGLVNGAVLYGLNHLGVPGALASALAVGAGLLLTGALHEDGLADTADGFGGGRDRVHRLAIMSDNQIGSYGTLALIVAVAVRCIAYVEISQTEFWTLLAITTASGAFSRSMVVDLMWSTSSAKTDGLAVYAGRPSRNTALFAIVSGMTFVAIAGFLFRWESALFAVALAACTAALMRFTAMRLIGGQTGDVCGAVQVLSELAMLAVFASMVR